MSVVISGANFFVSTGRGVGASGSSGCSLRTDGAVLPKAPLLQQHEVGQLHKAVPYPPAVTAFALLKAQPQQMMKSPD